MALPDLASPADLAARDVVLDPSVQTVMLAVASTVVRGAAGSPILAATSTVDLDGWGDQLLTLPGQPVSAVSAVEVDGEAVSDFRLLGGRLWRRCGWGRRECPVNVAVTYTHGLAVVPADIVDLVCNLTVAGANALADGEGVRDPRAVMERIDDYQVTWGQGAEAVASVMELPAGTRRMLAARFGGGAGMVSHR